MATHVCAKFVLSSWHTAPLSNAVHVAQLFGAMYAGGVSMGDRDFIKPLLERHGKVYFGKVRMKPGKPLTFATIELDPSRCCLRPLVYPASLPTIADMHAQVFSLSFMQHACQTSC